MEAPLSPSLPFSFSKGIILPLLLWMVFTPWSGELDLKTSHAFYNDGAFTSNPFWSWLYFYGLLPAWITVFIAILGFIFSFKKKYRSWRTPALYLLLTFAIGSGLIIHAALKDHWGRPRPRQVTEFGGLQPYRPYYEPNIDKLSEPSKSFPCGHASLGYYFFAFVFLGSIYRSRLIYWLGFALAGSLGISLSIARIAQGGHFLSDTIASALIMWLVSWGIAYWLFAKEKSRSEKSNA